MSCKYRTCKCECKICKPANWDILTQGKTGRHCTDHRTGCHMICSSYD